MAGSLKCPSYIHILTTVDCPYTPPITLTSLTLHWWIYKGTGAGHAPQKCMRRIFYSASVGVRCIVINPSVCLCVCVCVCLSVREHISATAGPIFTKFVVQIPRAVAGFSSGGIAIRYVLPVLWMTSRLAVMGGMAKHGGCTTVKRLSRAALRYRGGV